MTRRLHILLPMGGLGSRFASAGYELPKPMIPVDDQPMFMKALSSLEHLRANAHVTMVLRGEHEQQFGLATAFRKSVPDAAVVVIEHLTRGAVETCLHAREHMTGDDGLVVMDCDLWFRSPRYVELVGRSLADPAFIDGCLVTFAANEPRYSYAERDGARVLRTAEKVVISSHAIAGSYYFASESLFLRHADWLVGQNLTADRKEFYLSLLYNRMLQEGARVLAADAESFASFGTPEELEAYAAQL